MIHNWADNFHVRPRTWAVVEEDGAFVSNYVLLKAGEVHTGISRCTPEGRQGLCQIQYRRIRA